MKALHLLSQKVLLILDVNALQCLHGLTWAWCYCSQVSTGLLTYRV